METIILKPQSQRGQATVEIILVLMVTVLIALGLIYRFNTAFKKYTTDMYGSYYRCLLETGELPGTGSVCGDKQARFNIANGRDLLRDGSGGSGGGSSSGGGGDGSGSDSGGGGNGKGSNGGKGGGSSGGQAGQDSGSEDGGGGGSSGGGGSETVGGRGRTSGGGTGSVIGRLRDMQKPRSTAVGKASDAGGGDVAHEEGSSISVGSLSRAQAEGLRRVQTKMEFKMDGAEYRREETAAVAPATAAPSKKKVQAGDSLRPRKAVEVTDRKVASTTMEDKGRGFEFGRIFRLFIIFGLIVAIVIFLGGQMLQISKSGEK